MEKRFLKWTLVALLALVPVFGAAQQVTLNDSSIVVKSPFRSGMNLGCISFYDNCQVFKNLVGYNNPNMEPGTIRQIENLKNAGTATTFTDYNQYNLLPANFWTGGNFQVLEAVNGGPEKGCQGTIASNAGLNVAYVTAWSWDGTSVATFTGSNSYVAGVSTVAIWNLGAGSFLNGKTGNVTAANSTSFTVSGISASHAAASSGDFGYVQTNSTYTAPVYSINPVTNQGKRGCAAPFSAGDIVLLYQTVSPTPQTWWDGNYGGIWKSSSSGGVQMLSDTADLCATCGSQALDLHFPSSDGTISLREYYDATPTVDYFVLMNGTYQGSFWAKAASGSPRLTTHAHRGDTGGFDCGTQSYTLTAAWQNFTFSCTAAETAAGLVSGGANAELDFNVAASGGAADAYLDNVSFQKTAPVDSTNNTVFRDEVVQAYRDFYPQPCSVPGTMRYWVNQNAESIDNWTRPDYARNPTGTGYGIGPGGQNAYQLSLEDFLVLVQNIQATTGCPVYPYIEIPVTVTNADAANLVEFLAAPPSATTSAYGQRRVNLGQRTPWTSVFNMIYLSFGNECWNNSFMYQYLRGDSTGGDSSYADYAVRARHVYAAMRGNTYYPSNVRLGMNVQTQNNWSADAAIKLAKPDFVEGEDYSYGSVSSFATPAAIWAPLYFEVALQMLSSTDPHNFYADWKDYGSQDTCGGSGTAHCQFNIYEQGEGTSSGSISNSQVDLDHVNAGAGYGIAAALQFLIHQQVAPSTFGPQNYFALNEYRNGSSGSATAKLWGIMVDMGGASAATNAGRYGGSYTPRPQYLALQLANKSMIGPMFSCPITSGPTYNFPGSSTNGPSGKLPALANVPYLFAFCFENGTNRSLLFLNTDTVASHTISLAGSNLPTGTVTQRQYAVTSNPNAMNEADSGTYTGNVAGAVSITNSRIAAPTSLTLPPYSVTAIDYVVSGNM